MFLVASLALVGIFPFAGFFSKDSIIAATLNVGWYGYVFCAVALVGTFLTGLYTFRLFFIVFPGEAPTSDTSVGSGLEHAPSTRPEPTGEPSPLVEGHTGEHHGEGPRTMLVPVAVLTVLSAVGGWIQFSPYWHPLTSWLEPAARTLAVAEPTKTQEWVTTALALGLGIAGIGVAYAIYGTGRLAVPRLPAVQRALEHKLYFDEAYDALFYRPVAALAASLRREFEEPVVLASGPDLGEGALELGEGVRRLQTGLLRTYVFFLGTGMAVLAIVFLVVR
jgi:NADH-quinone oxidoreductase subunit L